MLKLRGAIACVGLFLILFWGANYKTAIINNATLLQSLKIQVEIAEDKIPPEDMLQNSWDYSNYEDERKEVKKRQGAVDDLIYQNDMLYHQTLIKIAMTVGIVIILLWFVGYLPKITFIKIFFARKENLNYK